MTKLTVAVCTHNRVDILTNCIESLLNQSAEASEFEIFIVDNASTDDTAVVAKAFQKQHRNVRYFFEPVAGLARARNVALRKTKSPLIAFTDDDAEVAQDWVQRIVDRFEQLGDRTAVLAGEIDPIWEAPPPDWLTLPLQRTLSATQQWADTARELASSEWPCEVNCAYRTNILQELGGFPEELGRKAQLLLSGENHVNEGIKAKGYKIFFDPEIRVRHFIPAERVTKEWFRRRYFWQGVTNAKANNLNGGYGLDVEYWRQVFVPLSPAEWVSVLDDSSGMPFDEACGKLSGLGYLLGLTNVVMGR